MRIKNIIYIMILAVVLQGVACEVSLFDVAKNNLKIGNWAWFSGSTTINQTGVYGTKGISAMNNVPGARSMAVSWTDSSGNLWLFGGEGYDKTTGTDPLNDLWKFDAGTKRWTWMSGSDTFGASGDYGTLGVPAVSNVPGARESAASWADQSGNLWLFGGYVNLGDANCLSDLWKYDPDTGYWTWEAGPSTANNSGTYGTKGTPAASNVPGARRHAVSWIDSDGELWLFGGYGYDSAGTHSYLNDLWKYDPDTGYWTWVSGSNTVEQSGIYEDPDAAVNVPGARTHTVSWVDSEGKLWLFGGYGFDSVGTRNLLNDLWRYDPDTGNWTWISGSSTVMQAGTYGVIGEPGEQNIPGARESSISWTGRDGLLWLFSGSGCTTGFNGRLNDLWRYDPDTGYWTWIAGSDTISTPGTYGSLGKESETNMPGARESAVSWRSNDGALWLFGGSGYDSQESFGRLNDLWRYVP